MIPRHLKHLLVDRLATYPAVALIGPRQCGKTTLARSLDCVYFDLEQEPERLRLDLEWDRLMAGKKLLILDEAQAWPEVFRRLRGAIDEDRRRLGRFLLLGSVSPWLMVQVSELLAGRLPLVELTLFLWTELETEPSRERRWICGGYPDGGVLTPRPYPQWQMDYLALLSQRDLPNWGLPAKPQATALSSQTPQATRQTSQGLLARHRAAPRLAECSRHARAPGATLGRRKLGGFRHRTGDR